MGDYFDAEMRLLQEAAQEFSRAFPEKAGMLNLEEIKDRDPYVERLLEGMAFLTAQVKQRLDDDVPEISETLLSHLWPHFLRPFPSLTIAQFAPRQGQVQKTQVLEKGAVVMSPPVGDERTICRFRTTAAVELQPLRLSRFSMAESGQGGSVLTLGFQLDAGIFADTLDLHGLKLFLHADPAVALTLYQALTTKVRRVQVGFPAQEGGGVASLGGSSTIRGCHLGAEDLLAPSSGRSFHGFHLLQEYFCFRDKFQFVRIGGLDRIAWPSNCSEFEVIIHLDCLIDSDFRLGKENFRLFCAPAINLFAGTSEPVSLSHRRTEYPVVADVSAPDGVQVYSIDQVTGTDAASGRRAEYSSLHAFRHGNGKGRFYQVLRRGGEGLRPQAHLRVGGSHSYSRETLSCRITASNGDYPRRFLQVGNIQIPGPELPSFVQVANLIRPSRMLAPPRRKDFRLALVSHLAVNFSTLGSAEDFQRLLTLYDWSELPQNQRRIEGIRQVAIKPVDRIKRGALLRGVAVTLTLHQENYLSEADIHLFGTVLHHFMCMHAPINTFVESRINLHPSNRELKWEPLLGENILL